MFFVALGSTTCTVPSPSMTSWLNSRAVSTEPSACRSAWTVSRLVIRSAVAVPVAAAAGTGATVASTAAPAIGRRRSRAVMSGLRAGRDVGGRARPGQPVAERDRRRPDTRVGFCGAGPDTRVGLREGGPDTDVGVGSGGGLGLADDDGDEVAERGGQQ